MTTESASPELAAQLDAQPSGLGAAGVVLWRGIAGHWVLRPDELRVLADAAATADVVERLQDYVEDNPLVVGGSQGQPRLAPWVAELRLHRASLAGLLRGLDLPDEDAENDGGLTDAQRSAAARSAAHARWHGRGA